MLTDNMSALTYAARLAERHSDVGFILAMVKREFTRVPSREQVERLRAEALAKAERKAWLATKYDRVPACGRDAKRMMEARCA